MKRRTYVHVYDDDDDATTIGQQTDTQTYFYSPIPVPPQNIAYGMQGRRQGNKNHVQGNCTGAKAIDQ